MQDNTTNAPASLTWETNTWTGSGVGRYNEDYALVDMASKSAVLVDGATGLTKVNVVQGESDAAWYARHLCKATVAHLAKKTLPAAKALADAAAEVAATYRSFDGAGDLQRIDEPNGSVAVLHWDASQVTVVTLADCTVVVGLQDGTCKVIYDDTLAKLDNQNYERMYSYATSNGVTMAEARRALNPRFIENRLKMNEPGGYWAADISCRGMEHATTTSFDFSDVSWVFACTDGYANAVDMGVTESFESLARAVADGGGVKLGKSLRAAETEDAACWRVHRSKTSDDATYLLVRF
ncbi:MAG: hypothetical protein J6D34_04700 [Atopobiaceae bacterium]|nr:hypothetical protein [Atopobiaceae bacterium]